MSKNDFVITLPSILEHTASTEALEILASSQIYSAMLWPEAKDDKNRTLYMSLCLKKVHEILQKEQGARGHEVFTLLLDQWVGGWTNYTDNLSLANFPQQGKGSLQDRALQGYIVGCFLESTLFSEEAISISEAIRKFSEQSENSLLPEIPYVSEKSFMKNYWTRYKNVAHFWCALLYFTFPEASDCIVRLDKALPQKAFMDYGHGWRGIVAVAHALLEKSFSTERYKTHKPLLDSEKSLRIIFSDHLS